MAQGGRHEREEADGERDGEGDAESAGQLPSCLWGRVGGATVNAMISGMSGLSDGASAPPVSVKFF